MRLARMLADAGARRARGATDCRRSWRSRARGCRARIDGDGEPVLLEAQDRSAWDQLLIRRGLAALEQAEAARGTRQAGRPLLPAGLDRGRSTPEPRRAEDTDWRRIAILYDVLAEAAPGPVVEVNRAVAHGRAFDAGAGLAVLEELDAAALGDSPLRPERPRRPARAAGSHADAAKAFAEAAARTRNEGERAVLQLVAEENRAVASRTPIETVAPRHPYSSGSATISPRSEKWPLLRWADLGRRSVQARGGDVVVRISSVGRSAGPRPSTPPRTGPGARDPAGEARHGRSDRPRTSRRGTRSSCRCASSTGS